MRPQIIYAVNIEDQIVKRYRSMNECSRVLNITPDVFYRCLKNGDLINDKYLVARSKEELKLLYEERYTVIYLKDIVIEHSNKAIAQPSYAVDAEPPKTEVKDAEQIRQPVITKTPATERQQFKPSTRNDSIEKKKAPVKQNKQKTTINKEQDNKNSQRISPITNRPYPSKLKSRHSQWIFNDYASKEVFSMRPETQLVDWALADEKNDKKKGKWKSDEYYEEQDRLKELVENEVENEFEK